METIEFGIGSVPVAVAAKVYGKDPCWVRAGIINGWLPIGYATRDNEPAVGLDGGRTNFYISPYKLYMDTGFVWRGEHRLRSAQDSIHG